MPWICAGPICEGVVVAALGRRAKAHASQERSAWLPLIAVDKDGLVTSRGRIGRLRDRLDRVL